ncbi:glycosyltransferase family 25 protein [Haemophilus haemolyticus]|uniref:glycosyltransferase family 25 protein n=1 Tax=Haemophilus haemolyticus TaxID=726 RepID=UPI00112CA1EA|nr:glycosyltransferase family 25 protein [Haemophilus haemolyticus]TPH04806.1 lipooligosaccharide biosynthesis protein lic2B [Haemophilus haemolyticus]
MHTNYVISLSSASQRREHIIKEFGKHHIPFEFYDAITPSECLNQLIQTYLPNLAHAKLSEGEKACFMSHYMLWKKCIDERSLVGSEMCIRDRLGEDAYSFLAEDEWLKERFTSDDSFILRFETFLKPAKCENVKISSFKSRLILKLVEEQYGLAAYVISKNAVISLFRQMSRLTSDDIDAIDILAFRDFLNLDNVYSYQIIPAISIQELQWKKSKSVLYSQLEDERYKILKDNKVKNSKKTLIEHLFRLITKPKRLLYKRKRKKYIVPFR